MITSTSTSHFSSEDKEPEITLSDLTSVNDDYGSTSRENSDKKRKVPLKTRKTKPISTKDQFFALFKKNYRLQKRSKKTNVCIGFVALFVVFLIFAMQILTDKYLNSDREEIRDPKKYDFDLFPSRVLPFAGSESSKFLGTYQPKLDKILTSFKYPMEAMTLLSSQLMNEKDQSGLDQVLYDTFDNNEQELVSGFYMNSWDLEDGKKVLDYKVYYNSSGSNSWLGFNRNKQDDLGQTLFLPSVVNLVNRASFSKVWDDSGLNGTIKSEYGYNLTGPDIRVGLKNFPVTAGKNQFDLVLFVQPFYYTFLLHFLLPVFMIIVVYEKENKLVDIMIMFGLKMKVYWSVNFIFNYGLYMILIFVFYVSGYALQFRFFLQNNFLAHFILFVLWGFSMVSLAFFLSTLFNKVRTASLIGYFLVIILALVSFLIWDNIIAGQGTASQVLCMLLPSFALYSGIKVLSDSSSISVQGFKFSNFALTVDGLGVQYLMLVACTVIYLVLGAYIYTILPSTGGKKSAFFFLTKKFWRDMRRKRKNAKRNQNQYYTDEDQEKSGVVSSEDSIELHEDPRGENIPEDVESERQRVIVNNDPIRLINLKKIYKGQDGNPDKLAVNCLTLGIKLNECFGILGPNGAGKTTAVNILSGLFPLTSGQAKICGFDVTREMNEIHTLMSVCPQHDILWGDQSGEETLEFYARMHGFKNEKLDKRVKKTLEEVGLYDDRKKLIKEYSGGMKRRISVACALITNPQVIFLDEPTTGLDPASKRQVWDVIRKARKKKSIILTTHSMEEADSLCDRIGIMANGILRTIGESQELKTRFGKGFKFMVHCSLEDEERVKKFVMELFPNANEMNSLAGTSNYEVPTDEVVLSEVFQTLEEQKNDLGIIDWGISQTTLEEVFHEITKMAEGKDQFNI
ncbi:atp-binding cassette transporter subfamily a abca [Anaeramoeba flamelloides]|uniref:Atp-binding cassette transporter subfamily a abca n=1 Tax=Anaeramoeba flamelloides TaxID=1746091 RepID=A0ABQ8XU41_9EUKA|nr:atp-binding cassette transporter subfamily a abca [Anaeramoeba flamelloides]